MQSINIIIGGADKVPLPHPIYVSNDEGVVLITSSGGAGNYLSVLDLDMSTKIIDNFKYSILPVNSEKIDTLCIRGVSIFYIFL